MPFMGGSGEIRFVITAQDNQAISTMKSVSQEMGNMGNATQNVTQQIQSSGQAMAQAQTQTLSFGGALKQNILSVGILTSSVVGLIAQYISYRREANTLLRSENMVANSRRMIADLTTKLQIAQQRYGQNSNEVASIQAKLTQAQNKYGQQLQKVDILQEQHRLHLIEMAGTALPNLINVTSSAIQIITNMQTAWKNTKPAIDSVKTATVAFNAAQGSSNTVLLGTRAATAVASGGFNNLAISEGKAGAAALVLGSRLKLALLGTGIGAVAVVLGTYITNLGGMRDRINELGASIAGATPQIKPFLDTLGQIGTVMVDLVGGKMPTSFQRATGALGKFGGGASTFIKSALGIQDSTAAMGDQMTVSGKEIEAFNKRLEDAAKAGNDLWMALGVKGKERGQLLKDLGLKGMKGLKGGGGLLDDIFDVTGAFNRFNKTLEFQHQFDIWDKFFVLPKGMGKRLAMNVSHSLQEMKQHLEPVYKKQIGELQNEIKADAQQGGKNTAEIIAQYIIDHPELEQLLRNSSFVTPEVQTILDEKRAELAQEVLDDKKWDDAFNKPAVHQKFVNGVPVGDPTDDSGKVVKKDDTKGAGIFQGVIDSFTKGFESLKTTLHSFDFAGVGATLRDDLNKIFTTGNVVAAGKWFGDNILTPIFDLAKGVGATLQSLFGNSVQAFIDDPWATINSVADTVTNFFAGAFGYPDNASFAKAVSNGFDTAWSGAVSLIGVILQDFKKDPVGFLIGKVKPVTDFVSKLFGFADTKGMVKTISEEFAIFGAQIIHAIDNYIQNSPWLFDLLHGDIIGSLVEIASLGQNQAHAETLLPEPDLKTSSGKLMAPIISVVNETWSQIKAMLGGNNKWLFELASGNPVGALIEAVTFLSSGGNVGEGKTNKNGTSLLDAVTNKKPFGDQNKVNKDASNTQKGVGDFFTGFFQSFDQNKVKKAMDDLTKNGPRSLTDMNIPGFDKWLSSINPFDDFTGDNHFAYGDTGKMPKKYRPPGAKPWSTIGAIKAAGGDPNVVNSQTVPGSNMTPQFDTMNRQINQVIKNLQALGAASSKAMNGLRANLNVGFVAASHLQIGLANLANQGTKSLNLVWSASAKAVTGVRTNFNIAYVAAGHLQVGVANLANEGTSSLNALWTASAKAVTGLRKNLNIGYVSAGHLQVGFANLANEGSSSLDALWSASAKAITGIRKNLNIGYVSAGHLQVGLANLANEGSSSMSALAKSAKTNFNTVANYANGAADAVNSLQDAIDNLKSKKITIELHRKITGDAVGGGGAIRQFGGFGGAAGGGGVISAARGFPGFSSPKDFTTHGPQLMLVGDNPGGEEDILVVNRNNPGPVVNKINQKYGLGGGQEGGVVFNGVIQVNISGNDIVNEKKLVKKIKMSVGQNMSDRFG